MTSPLTVAVLAGGASRRMGTDKVVLEIGGIALVDHVLAAAGGLPTLVVGRPHPTSHWVDDPTPERLGPLAGLVAALTATAGPVLVVGADQPWLRSATVQALASLDRPDEPVAPLDAGVLQVLCAVYPQQVLAPARRLLASGNGLQALLDTGCRQVPPDEWRRWGEDGRSWFSVDTPDQMAEGVKRYGSPG
jgi:molybdopterin-guanine dinucleotide biosynthesis protein A